MRARNKLHMSKLQDFKSFLEGMGWTAEQTKGQYEVLRMRNPEYNEPLLVYTKANAKEHYTTYGLSNRFLTKFFNSRSN